MKASRPSSEDSVNSVNDEALMMDALDGTISAADLAKLDAYFAQRPDERLAFQRMLAVDAALRQVPVTPPPSDFSQAVVARARSVPIAKPVNRHHLVAFIVTNSVLATLVWLVSFAMLFGLVGLLLQQPFTQPIIAFAHGINIYVADAFNLFTRLTRSLVTQPIVWVTALVSTALVVTWLSVMARVLAPAHGAHELARTQP